jgi:hypothetical protein
MKKKLKKGLTLAASALFGGLAAFVIMKFLLQPTPGPKVATPLFYKLAILPIMPLGFLIVIAVHELGHVLAGRLVKFQFRILTIGPFMWEMEAGTIRFKWNKNLNAYGGLALCLPLNTQNLVQRFIWFAAGGPLASFLLAIAAYLGLRFLTPAGPSFANYTIEFLWIMLTTLSAIICVVTLIPMRSGGFYSDGARILNFLKGGPTAKLDAVTLQTISFGYAGKRPRLLDPAPLLEAIDLPVTSTFKTYLHAYLYMHYLDCGKVEQAKAHLEKYTAGVEEIPKGYRAVVYLENTWFEAIYHSDAVRARSFFNKSEIGAFIPKSQLYRAEAALALAEGNPQLAMEKANTALKALPNAMDKGAAIAEKEWLEDLLEKAHRYLEQPSAQGELIAR